MTDEQMEMDVNTEPDTEAPAEESKEEQSAAPEGEAEKESGTLLSDDGGDDAGSTEGEKSEEEGEAKADAGVPDEYVYTPPEGLDLSEEDQTKLGKFAEFARENEMSQDLYQKIVDYNFGELQAATEELHRGFEERINQWGEEVRADKEFGGENLKANIETAKKVISGYGSEGFQKMLDKPSENNPDGLGLGNHPEMIRFLHRIGKSIGESEFIEGDGHKVNNADGLQRMYPTMDQFK